MNESGLRQYRFCFLAFCLAGFIVFLFLPSTLLAKPAFSLLESDEAHIVIVFGFVNFASEKKLRLCMGSSCVDAIFVKNAPFGLVGKKVWVKGVYRHGALFVRNASDVDVVG
jgi:hypothetical protein